MDGLRGVPRRLKERKIVQWAVAYLAVAWVAVEAVDVFGDIFSLPVDLQRGAVVVLAFGFVITLVVAWYHGEKGRQRVSGPELLMVAGVMVMAGATLTLVRDRSGVAPPTTASQETGYAEGAERSELDPRSIAVLPFADLSPGRDQRYLGDGIAEELLSVLSQIDGLRLASRTSSFSFGDETLDVREIGERLGVGHVIEGSVRKSGDRLRVEARLVSVQDGFRIWSERFDTEAADIFAVQDSIAHAVARALRVRLSEDASELALRGQTSDPEAQDLYLKGRFAWNRRTQGGLERAVRFFEEAVSRDPEYARALVGLGDAYAVLGFYDYRPPNVAFPRAQDAAYRALAIDSTLAEPHATLGYAALYFDWDWEEAELRFLRAIELDPTYPVAHQWYGNYLTAMGKFEDAAREMRTASELDPLSTIAFAATGWVYYFAGDYERAIRQLREVVERDPTFDLAYLWSGQAHAELGRLEDAAALIRRAVDLSGSAISRAAMARVLALQGRTAEARRILQDLESEGETEYVPSYEIARAYVGLRRFDTAVRWLERAFEERAHSMVFLRVDPQLEPLDAHPGYRSLLRQVGL